jgi:hypothetical protein
MINKTGWTLIELFVYMGLMVLLVFLVGSFVSSVNLFLYKNSCEREGIIRRALALDILTRDLISCSCDYLNCDLDNNIFMKRELSNTGKIIIKWVGWECDSGGLIRSEGDYNIKTHRWGKRVKSFACKEIKELKLIPYLNNSGDKVLGIEISYVYKKENQECKDHIWVRVRSRGFSINYSSGSAGVSNDSNVLTLV